MKTYEMDLSEGYDKVKIIKSRDRKDNIVEMICIISPSLLLLILWDYICKGYYRTVSYATSVDSFNPTLLLIPLIPAYIILHELVHGIIYLILTEQKNWKSRAKT